ncbi:hypothetical protein EZV62_025720 [Acer yangbiense]|uniref:Uncharacterized protein n=1 Tax=Acer yangbiense TaxID=1000413 RepID=A0A5C7GZB6_9ROSI|nr:hypothetical protein EZV62_025720 [Acer yangbiense]
MALSVIHSKSASSLVLTASRLTRVNINYHSAVFSASSHLNRKPTLGSFVPDFDFSSATETKKCSSINESLLQAIDLEIKRADHHVEETPNEFTLKIENSINGCNVVLIRKYQDELVEVSSTVDQFYESGKYFRPWPWLYVTISNNGGSSLMFDCFHTSDAILILRMVIIKSETSKDSANYLEDHEVKFNEYLDKNLEKAFYKYLEMRGIKPSIADFFIKWNINKNTKRKLALKKIKNFIEQLS